MSVNVVNVVVNVIVNTTCKSGSISHFASISKENRSYSL